MILSTPEEILPLVSGNMARRGEVRGKAITPESKANQRTENAMIVEFSLRYSSLAGQYVFLRDTKLTCDKNVLHWNGPFIISGFAGEHQSSYKSRKLDSKTAPSLFHVDHLRLFQERTGYLRRADEENLPVMKNLRKVRKKVMEKAQRKAKFLWKRNFQVIWNHTTRRQTFQIPFKRRLQPWPYRDANRSTAQDWK